MFRPGYDRPTTDTPKACKFKICRLFYRLPNTSEHSITYSPSIQVNTANYLTIVYLECTDFLKNGPACPLNSASSSNVTANTGPAIIGFDTLS